MAAWNFSPWSLPYVLSALISTWLSWSTLKGNRDSPAHQRFAAFGLASSLYLIASFLMTVSPDQDLALKLAILSESFYFISIGLLAHFAYGLVEVREGDWRVLIIPLLITGLSPFIPRDVRLTGFGWVITASPTITIEGLLTFLYLVSYTFLVGLTFYNLMKKARVPWLSRKYRLMLVGYLLFQVVGVVLSNSLMLVFRDMPHFGGLLYFFSLASIWYGFKMEKPREVRLTQAGSEFSDAYGRFINRFLEVAPSDELGLKTIDLLEYLDKTRLSEFVTYDRLRIILNADSMQRLDNIQALDKTMEYLETKEWSGKLANPLLDVLEGVHQSVLDTQEKLEGFKGVLSDHQGFLKKTDVIYGFHKGQFLEFIGPDDSLSDRPDWEVALRTYKRWLLPVRGFLVGEIAPEFYKNLRSMDVVKHLDVSPEGEISIERVLSYAEVLPQERRAEAVRTGFNALMSWVAQNLAAKDSASFTKWLKTIRRIVLLNSGTMGVLKTYASVVTRLSRDMGRSRIRGLVLLESHRAEELDAFSSTLGLSHESLLHERILVEYDPRFLYEYYIGQLLSEVSANTEHCVVFTRSGGVIQRMATGLENIECRILATPGVEEEGSVPFNDITRLIHAVSTALDSEMETWILFDNLSDLILPVGVEQAYVFARHATDLIGARNGSAVFLMNRSAHGQADRAAFEGLFSKIVEIGEKLSLVKG